MKRSPQSWVILLASLLLAVEVRASETDVTGLKAADAAWNDAMQSRSHERVAGFYAKEAIADLAPGPPVHGKAAISAFWAEAFKDPKYKLHWELESAGIIEGSELGYTIGKWYQQSADGTSTGVYVAVWQKQPDARWLVLIDTARE